MRNGVGCGCMVVVVVVVVLSGVLNIHLFIYFCLENLSIYLGKEKYRRRKLREKDAEERSGRKERR